MTPSESWANYEQAKAALRVFEETHKTPEGGKAYVEWILDLYRQPDQAVYQEYVSLFKAEDAASCKVQFIRDVQRFFGCG